LKGLKTVATIRTYKYKLYQTKRLKKLHNLVDIAGEIYNHSIALHKRYYKMFGKSLHIYKLQKHITKLKKLKKYSSWNELGSQSIQEITERIDKGFKKFFDKKAKRPTFKRIRDYSSFTFKGEVGYKIIDNVIFVNGYKFKFWLSREIDNKIKSVTIKRDNIGDFYICVSFKVENNVNITSGKIVGIDFGLKHFLTLSDNTKIESPQFHLKNLSKIKKLNRKLSKSKKCSTNRKAYKKQLSKLHIRITNQRKDYLNKLSNDLASKYNRVFIEDLDLKAMQKIWGRKVDDLSFAKFITILSYKTNVHKIDRFYPSSKICSSCGTKNEQINNSLESLNKRTFVCNHCGLTIDRDLNASINIYRVGVSTLGLGDISLQNEAFTV
jgi:putative transposase